MMPAGPPIPPAMPCLCRVEHFPDGSRVFPHKDCPQHKGNLTVPLPRLGVHGLAEAVTETPPHTAVGAGLPAIVRRPIPGLAVPSKPTEPEDK